MKTTKTLKDYNRIYREMETATIQEIAEAAAYFSSIGGQFTDRAKALKKRLDAYAGTDLFKEAGVEALEFEFSEDAYSLKESSINVTDINSKEILKLKDFLPADFFEVVTTINKESIVKAFHEGKLPDIIKPYVTIYTQTSLTIKKKPTRKAK